MLKFLVKRLLLIPVAVFLISSVVFLFSNLIPGTYADRHLESTDLLHAGRVENKFSEKLPLFYISLSDKIKPTNYYLPQFSWHGSNNRYHQWAAPLFTLNLGTSYRDGRPVDQLLKEAFFNTLFLLLASLALIFWGSITLSRFLVARNKTGGRSIILTLLYILDSIPLFIIALLLLTFLAGSGYLKLFPVFGLGLSNSSENSWFLNLGNHLHHMVLPLFCLVVTGFPYVTAQLYNVMQSVKANDFVMTARAKGLSEKLVLNKHVFSNALLPLITIFTGYLPGLISGAVIIEIIFAIPGTGRLLSESILARDYPVVMGLILLLATIKVSSNVLADLLYYMADPRTRQSVK